MAGGAGLPAGYGQSLIVEDEFAELRGRGQRAATAGAAGSARLAVAVAASTTAREYGRYRQQPAHSETDAHRL
jgi:hypothetical protein